MGKVASTSTCGFVYIWYDKKHKRFYIGSHWGEVNDGYICSSNWMLAAYKRRPNDFTRRILKIVYSNRDELYSEEFRWLQLIKEEELGKRYYNLRCSKYFGETGTRREEWNKKIGDGNRGKKRTEEQKKHLSKVLTGRKIPREVVEKVIKTRMENNYHHSDETKKKLSEHAKRLHEKGIFGRKGATVSEETKRKMSESAKERIKRGEGICWGKPLSEETKMKISESNKRNYIPGKHWYHNGIQCKRFLDEEAPDGWERGFLRKNDPRRIS